LNPEALEKLYGMVQRVSQAMRVYNVERCDLDLNLTGTNGAAENESRLGRGTAA